MYSILSLPLASATNQSTFAITPPILWLLIGVVFGAIELLIQETQPKKYRLYALMIGVSALIESCIVWWDLNRGFITYEDFNSQIFYWMEISLALSILVRPIFIIREPHTSGCLVLLSRCLLLLMCIGVMIAMIALPLVSSIANKSKQSEAKYYLSSMHKGQQAYLAEKGAFTNSIDALRVGIKTETAFYKYSIFATQTSVFHYAVANQPGPKNYLSSVFLVPAYPDIDNPNLTTTSILCEAEDRRLIKLTLADKPAEPTYKNGKVICGTGTIEVSR